MRWPAVLIGGLLLLLSHCVVAQVPSSTTLESSQVSSVPTPPPTVSRVEAPDIQSISKTEDVPPPASISPASNVSLSQLVPNRTRTKSHSATVIHPHTFSRTFIPFTSRRPLPPPPPIDPDDEDDDSDAPHGQPVVAIVFECFAGVLGLFLLAGLTRCAYKYKRAPARDRIAALISRHQLEREMAQIERSDLQRRTRPRASMAGPPPPPYQPAPTYDSVVPPEAPCPENAENV